MVRIDTKRKINNMINRFKIFFFIFLLSTSLSDLSKAANDDDIYKKIDLFSEVLDKINKEYVDEINQSEAMEKAEKMAKDAAA